jgi:hypothetical protein
MTFETMMFDVGVVTSLLAASAFLAWLFYSLSHFVIWATARFQDRVEGERLTKPGYKCQTCGERVVR